MKTKGSKSRRSCIFCNNSLGRGEEFLVGLFHHIVGGGRRKTVKATEHFAIALGIVSAFNWHGEPFELAIPQKKGFPSPKKPEVW